MANICDTTLCVLKRDNEADYKDTLHNDVLAWLKNDYEGMCDEVYDSYSDDEMSEYILGVRWAIQADDMLKLVKLFKVNVRAVGREDAIGFVQVICVEDDEITQDDCIDYKI